MYKIEVLLFYLSGIFAECASGFLTQFVKEEWGVENFYQLNSSFTHPDLKKNGLYIGYYRDINKHLNPIYVGVATEVNFGTRFGQHMKEDGKLFNWLPNDMRRLEAYYAQMMPMPQPAAYFNELVLLNSFNFLLNKQNNNKLRENLIMNEAEVSYESAKELYEIIRQKSLPYILPKKHPNKVSFER